MRRDGTAYGANVVRAVTVVGAVDVSDPKAGFYRGKLRSKSVVGGIHIWFGQPRDPETGELMDRSLRWQATFNGQYVEFYDVWPACAGDEITEMQHRSYVAQFEWARENAPKSSFANPKRRYDPLSSAEPLPF